MQFSSAVQPQRSIWLLLLLAVLTLTLFWPATGYDFVKLDDDQYVCENPHVTTGLSIENIRWAFSTVHEDWWLPLLWISFMADTSLFGPEPFGYHLTNILLHTTNVLLLFWVLFRMTGSRWRSFFVAALFAFHPLRVESVAWITARKDVLSGLFFLLCLMSHAYQAKRPSPAQRGLLALLMLLGLLSKAIVVVLPFVLLLVDYWPLRRAGDPWEHGAWPKWRSMLNEKIPLFALSILFVLINLHTHHDSVTSHETLTWIDRIGLVFPNYWAYLGLIFYPVHLSILYPEQDVVSWISSLAAAVGLGAIFVAVFRCRHQAPYALMGWAWFLLTLFPVIRGLRLGLAAYADRFVYLPSIGLAILLVWSASALAQKMAILKIPIIFLGTTLLGVLVARSAIRLPDWRDSQTMFARLLAFVPENGIAQNSYGKVLLEKGEKEASLEYFIRATELGNSVAPRNYADALLRLGRDRETIAWIERFLASSSPEDLDLHALLGLALLNEGRAMEAIPHLKEALQRSGRPLGLQIALIRATFEIGDAASAQQEIQTLQALGYPHIRDFDSLIVYYTLIGQSKNSHPAWCFFRNNLQTRPDNIVLLNNAAWLLATVSDAPAPAEEALRYIRRAIDLTDPALPPAILDTLAAALAANGLFEEARQTAQHAIDLAQQNGDGIFAAEIERRLAGYRQDLPWREDSKP